jgi:hypothetical protein
MGGNDAATEEDKTNPLNKGNMLFPTSIDELPDELRQKLQARINADTKAFLESCTKNRHDKVTQFREPIYGDATTSIGAEDTDNGKAKYDEEVYTDSYPTHTNYAKMLLDTKNTLTNTIQHSFTLLSNRMDKIEGKTTDCG